MKEVFRISPLAMIFIFTLFVTFSCREETEQITNFLESPDRSNVMELHMVMVNDLRLRTAPGQKSEVKDKLSEGTLVYSKGIRSDENEMIELRGMQHNTPYIFINQGSLEGWVYEGALLCLYKGETEAPFTARINEVASLFRKTGFKKMEAGGQYLSFLRRYKGSEPVWNDALFMIAFYYFNHLESTLNSEIAHHELRIEQKPKELEVISHSVEIEFFNQLQNNGLKPKSGTLYKPISTDWEKVLYSIGGPFTQGMDKALELMIIIMKNQESTDASTQMDLITESDIAGELENLLHQHPPFPLESWASTSYVQYAEAQLKDSGKLAKDHH
ncbi:MAG TPA: hypothetical protein PKC30_05310 [Saprospiraceae bacterium]|nr:hypothetical protein [Saprospiraceae bacterium]